MKELSIQINVIPVKTMSQEAYSFLADEFTIDPVPEKSDAGIIYNCNKDIIIDMPSTNTISEFSIEKSVLVEFKDTRGKKYIIGTTDLPAKVIITPHLNKATLSISCKMMQTPYK